MNGRPIGQPRREFLCRAIALASLAAGAGLAADPLLQATPLRRGVRANELADRDYATRETYDWLLSLLTTSPPVEGDENGRWSWQRSPVMMSYLAMYEATGDIAYLDRLVVDGDNALAARDSVRGVTDYTGASAPRWRFGNQYTTGSVVVPNSAGNPLFRIRIGAKGNYYGAAGQLVVTAPDQAGLFSLTSTDITGKISNTFSNLSLDPASPDYLVTKLYWANPNNTKTTAVDLRTATTTTDTLAPGSYEYRSEFSSNFVGTGVITTPLAWFAEIVGADPALADRFGDKADEFADAVEVALESFDSDWRENGRNEGWYVINPEAPSICAGADYPHNQNLIIGAAYTHLAEATGSTAHRRRAEKLFNRFRNDLIPIDAAYTWHYWYRGDLGFQGWTREDEVSSRIPYWGPYHHVEDLGHAYLDVIAAVTAHKHGLTFNNRHMMRFAATFTQKVATHYPDDEAGKKKYGALAGTPTTRQYVNGSGAFGTYDTLAGFWAALTDWDPSVLGLVRDILNARQYPPSTIGGYPPMSTAYLTAANIP